MTRRDLAQAVTLIFTLMGNICFAATAAALLVGYAGWSAAAVSATVWTLINIAVFVWLFLRDSR